MDHIDQSEAEQPSVPCDLNVQVRGFEERLANEVGHSILHVVREYSRAWPLENLDGVTIGSDYEEALASIDRGFSVDGPVVTPTKDEDIGWGIAMALPVYRDDIVKTHLVFGPTVVELVSSDDPNDLQEALRMISHELGHAVDHELKYRAFGNVLARKVNDLIPDPLEQYLWELSHFIWDEYFATRISSRLSHGKIEDELFVKAQGKYRPRIYEARTKYRDYQISLDKFLDVVKQNLHIILLATGYLLGLNDAQEDGKSPAADATKLLESADSKELHAFHEVLLAIWENCAEWKSYDELLELNRPTFALLHSLEVYPSVTDEGTIYIDVPVIL